VLPRSDFLSKKLRDILSGLVEDSSTTTYKTTIMNRQLQQN
jgi:hypothetical protein